jgi:hypothetical protein
MNAEPKIKNGIILALKGAGLLLLWGVVYWNLEPLSIWLTYGVMGLPQEHHFSTALQFFVFETPKVLMLLALIVFVVGIIRSFFTPERTRRILAGKS